MARHNAGNERIKRQYFDFLKEAKSQSDDSVNAAAKALARFEADTKYKSFRAFHYQQAIAFKKHLSEQTGRQSGENLSKATLYATLAHLKRFFQWLAAQPSFRSVLKYTDAEYFSLSGKDTRVATARRQRASPTLDQIRHVLASMPTSTDIELRNRALIAFTLLTGARDGAIASIKLKHVDTVGGSVFQDARQVKTKFSKSFTTIFFPVGDEVRQVVVEWVEHLRTTLLWGNDDPLFPATHMRLGATQQFEPAGLARKHWSTATPIRAIFKQAFTLAGLPYFNPHSVRNTLAQLGEVQCRNAEDLKAWSQNLGHEGVLTTLYSYGTVAPRRQAELLKELAARRPIAASASEDVAVLIAQALRQAGHLVDRR